MSKHHVQNTEYDLLRFLIEDEHNSKPGSTFLDRVLLYPEVFTEPCRGIYDTILKLRSEKRDVSYVSIKNENMPASVILSVSSTGLADVYITSKSDAIEAYNLLTKEYLWRQSEKLKEDYSNPEEYFKALAKLEVKNYKEVETFQATIENYLRQQGEKNETGITTHWKNFNEAVSPQRGEMTIIGARTSIGKTSFALNLAVQTASLGYKTLFVTLEMNKRQVMDKIGGILLKKPVASFKHGHFDFAEFSQEIQAIQETFQLEYQPACKTYDIEKLIQQFRPDVVVIDYLQLLKDETKKGETETNRLGKISAKLKEFAGKYNLLMIVPAQLNRDSEKQNREPRVSDLRDSGNIEQDADQVLLLHRESRSSQDTKLMVAKHRTGQVTDLNFDFILDRGLFLEC